MKKFEITVTNRKLLLLCSIPLILLMLTGIFYFSDFFIDNNNEKLLIIAAIPIILVIVLLTRICKKKYTIEITDSDFTVRENGKVKSSGQLNQIMLIKHYGGINFGSDTLIIYIDKQVKSILNITTEKQSKIVQDIIISITESSTFKKSQHLQRNLLWNEYLNEKLLGTNTDTLASIRTQHKSQTRKTVFIVISVFVLLIALSIAPFFINPSEDYIYKHDRVLYGDKVLEGVNPKEVKTLSYSVIKDSSHVYYNGKILEWADRATFTCPRTPFYYDKNGVYYETSNFYSKNKILPLEGEYDAATFESVGGYTSHYFKDKNHLYTLTVNMMDGDKSPLKKVEVEGLDVASFQTLEHSYWFVDKNRVYFGTWKDLLPCSKIDRQTFEVLSWTTAKDKNHVYYLTRDLSSENKKATEKEGYAILEGADALTFRKIDDRNYEDKNQVWTIRTKGEKISYRDNVQ